MKLYSNETIDFQVKGSPLANDLMEAFQECILEREKCATVVQRMNHVMQYFKTTTVPKLQKIFKKHLGITLNSVKISKSPDAGFACVMCIGDKYGITAADIINRYSGLDRSELDDAFDYLKKEPKTAQQMKVVAESLNRATGKFKNTMLPDKMNCEMIMYFDPYTAFLMKESTHVKNDYFSSPQITAIILHEIGHMVSCLANSANNYFRMQAFNRSLQYFKNNAPLSQKIKMIKSVVKDPKLASKLTQIQNECTAVDTDSANNTSVFGWFATIINSLYVVFFAPFVLISHIVGSIAGGIAQGVSFNSSAFGDTGLPAYGINKTSDSPIFKNQLSFCEDLADEFVSKHGLGSYQISALNKLWGCVTSTTNRNSTLYYAFQKSIIIVYACALGEFTTGGGLYRPLYERGMHVLQEQAKAFKQMDMSPQMRDALIEDYERCKQQVTKQSSINKFARATQFVFDFIKYVSGIVPNMLFTGRFSTEYEKLYNSARSLNANSLFYRATKLQKLGK